MRIDLTVPSLILYHGMQVAGFLLAIVLVVRLFREKHGPATTLAWLISFTLIPFVGVPLYLLIGGRKARRMLMRKGTLDLPSLVDEADDAAGERIPGLFPLRCGEHIRLLTDGQESYAVLIGLIQQARESISITTYVFRHDETGSELLNALCERARSGVRVRLLMDAVGSFTFTKKHLRRLEHAGGKFAFFMPMLKIPFRGRANLRNHRKLVIIDHTIAMLGGMNLANEYLGPAPHPQRWKDMSLVLTGAAVGDLFQVFRSDWHFASGEELPSAPDNTFAPGACTRTVQVIPSGPDVDEDPLHDAILQLFFRARKSIRIVTPYFVPDEMLVKALCVAVRRGVEVTIIVPQRSNHPIADFARRSFLRQMGEVGAKVCYYLPGMLHGKLIVVDEGPAIVGSMNVDIRSMFLNYEIALLVYDKSLIARLSTWTDELIGSSREGVKPAHTIVESIEGVGRIFAPLL